MRDSGPAGRATVRVGGNPIGLISARLYGALAEHLGRCCYGGLWLGPDRGAAQVDGFRRDAVEALGELPMPLLRWPGGCYADRYHWRDGVGEPASRPARLGLSCGLRTPDSNALGTHEFLRLCERLGAEPYLAGNLATGSAQEMCDWIEYVNADLVSALTRERAANGQPEPWRVRLWGLGNESWDCGGRFDPESYGHEYRRFAGAIRQLDPTVELVAVGLADDPLPESHLDADWNERLLVALGPSLDLVDHLSIHRYWINGGPEADFGEADYYALLAEAEATEALIERTATTLASAVAAAPTAPARRIRIALDEWGAWHPEARAWGPGEVARRSPPTFEQAATLRDALAAAIALEGFHRQCNVLALACLAQVVNVLHCVLATDGPACVRTPTYHALALHRPHLGAEALPVEVVTEATVPSGRAALSATASRRAGGVAVSLVNRHLERSIRTRIGIAGPAFEIAGPAGGSVARARLLTADQPNAANTALDPERVSPAPLDVDPLSDGVWTTTMPPHSIATLEFGPAAEASDGG
jgi:alpha-N-arabinofuranosidase